MAQKSKFDTDIISNNDLLHYLAQLFSIVYMLLEGQKDIALECMKNLEPEITEGVRQLAAAEGYKLPKKEKKSTLITLP